VGEENVKIQIWVKLGYYQARPNAGDPPGSRQVYDSFTTSSRHVHDKKSQPVDQLQFCPRHVHDLFTTRSRQISANEWFLLTTRSRQVHERSSREVSSVAGDLANLRPECRHASFTPSDVITRFYKPKPSHDVETKPTLLETYFFRWIIFNVTSLPHDSFPTRSRWVVNVSGTRWITRIKARNLCFWRPYIALCADTYCVLYRSEMYRYGATRWMVKHSGRVDGFLTRRIWKWDAKTKTGNIDPLLTTHVL
jgi:hypothetical protein